MNLNFLELKDNYPHANILYPTTHSMLLHYSDKYKDYRKRAKGTKELFERSGNLNFNKLYNNRKIWDKFIRNIPVKYFQYIGITESMLESTIKMDQEIYDKKIEEPYTYTSYSELYKSRITDPSIFGQGLNEVESIAKLSEWVIKKNLDPKTPYWIVKLERFPYYSIYFNADGSHYYWYYRPEYKITNQCYEFKKPRLLGLI